MRFKIPGDRLIRDAADVVLPERDVVEISGDGVALSTPDADTAVVEVIASSSGGTMITREQVVLDTFTRANGSVGTAETGQVYEVGATPPQIESNKLRVTYNQSAFINSGQSDVIMQATLVDRGFIAYWQMCPRYVNSVNFIALSESVLWKRVENSPGWDDTSLATISPGITNGDVVRIETLGSNIKVFVNDILRANVTETAHMTATRQGFRHDTNYSSLWDNFRIAHTAEVPFALVPKEPGAGNYYGRYWYYFRNGVSVTTSPIVNLATPGLGTTYGTSFFSQYFDLSNGSFYFAEPGLYSVSCNVSHALNSPTKKWSIYLQDAKAATDHISSLVESPVEWRWDSATDRHDAGIQLTDWFEPGDGFLLRVRTPSDMVTASVDFEVIVNKII